MPAHGAQPLPQERQRLLVPSQYFAHMNQEPGLCLGLLLLGQMERSKVPSMRRILPWQAGLWKSVKPSNQATN